MYLRRERYPSRTIPTSFPLKCCLILSTFRNDCSKAAREGERRETEEREKGDRREREGRQKRERRETEGREKVERREREER